MNRYKTRGGVCCIAIEYEIEDGKIADCRFIGGCSGNTQVILDTLENSMKLLNARKVRLPRYLSGDRHVKEVSLRALAGFSRNSFSQLFNIAGER